MFLLTLLTLPILAYSIQQDTIHFHTHITCKLVHKPVYHFEITFIEQDIVSEEIINRVEGTLLSGGEKSFTTSGILENGDEDVNYSLYARIRHDCVDDKEEVIKTEYVTGECKVGGEVDCNVFLNVDLDKGVVKVENVDQEPIPDYSEYVSDYSEYEN